MSPRFVEYGVTPSQMGRRGNKRMRLRISKLLLCYVSAVPALHLILTSQRVVSKWHFLNDQTKLTYGRAGIQI